jgi:hypothetical protein
MQVLVDITPNVAQPLVERLSCYNLTGQKTSIFCIASCLCCMYVLIPSLETWWVIQSFQAQIEIQHIQIY